MADQLTKSALPTVEQGVHVEDVIARYRRAVGSGRRFGQGRVGGAGHHEREGRAAATAPDLEERQVIAASEEADIIGGDGVAADGAEAVGALDQVVLRIHPRQVYRLDPPIAAGRSGCPGYSPGV
jgi:hypothetical protein